jgi:hypothetical protein
MEGPTNPQHISAISEEEEEEKKEGEQEKKEEEGRIRK